MGPGRLSAMYRLVDKRRQGPVRQAMERDCEVRARFTHVELYLVLRRSAYLRQRFGDLAI
jgi:hypothetical protein